jgi:hypothetical protein
MVDRELWCLRGRSLTEPEDALARSAYLEGTGEGERGSQAMSQERQPEVPRVPVNFRSGI